MRTTRKSINGYTHGQHFNAIVEGKPMVGVISISHQFDKETEEIFLCQGSRNGAEAINKLGLPYSYTIKSGTQEDLLANQVSEINLLPTRLTDKELTKHQEITKKAIEKKEADRKAYDIEARMMKQRSYFSMSPIEYFKRMEELEERVEQLESKLSKLSK